MYSLILDILCQKYTCTEIGIFERVLTEDETEDETEETEDEPEEDDETEDDETEDENVKR